jgi:hypothetical protein
MLMNEEHCIISYLIRMEECIISLFFFALYVRISAP